MVPSGHKTILAHSGPHMAMLDQPPKALKYLWRVLCKVLLGRRGLLVLLGACAGQVGRDAPKSGLRGSFWPKICRACCFNVLRKLTSAKTSLQACSEHSPQYSQITFPPRRNRFLSFTVAPRRKSFKRPPRLEGLRASGVSQPRGSRCETALRLLVP